MTWTDEWPREQRAIPADMAADAAAHPNGWVYEIDATQVPDPQGYVPPEAIIGEQVPGTEVEWLKIVDEPVFLTSGFKRGDPADGEVRLLTNRAAFAVIFVLAARSLAVSL